tara:strand:+ start:27241 stop:28044 length:804 start_codon:yes stop_codon:yes gene_type:complete
MVKISIHTTMTNPEARMDPWKESLECYNDFADEVVITGENWPETFKWDYIGQTFNEGLNKTTGDWAIRMDLDYLFHENDFKYIRNFIETNKDEKAIAFPKRQFFTIERYQLQSKICIAVNKGKFPEIQLNGGGDLCFPTINGELINVDKIPVSKVPVWNYDMMFKTKKIIENERLRFGKAWFDQFNDWGIFGGNSHEEAFNAWYEWVKEKYKKHIFKINLDDHPKYIQKKLRNLNEDQFGYSCFGLKNNTKFDQIEFIKRKILRLGV